MDLPKQSRPVIREASRDPIRARVERAQTDCGTQCAVYSALGSGEFDQCVYFCEQRREF